MILSLFMIKWHTLIELLYTNELLQNSTIRIFDPFQHFH